MGCCTSLYVSRDTFYPLVYISASDLDLPPPKPPSCRRNEIFNMGKYSAIEKHLSKPFPEDVLYGNFQTLARYVTKRASDDVGRLWAIYQWMASLDCDSLTRDFDRAHNADSPLDYADKINEGERAYAHMFAALVRALNIPCLIINGVAKNASYELGECVDRQTMTSQWNAVYVKNDWRLVDTYWGSHSITGRRFSDWAIVDADGDVITVEERTSDGKVRYNLKDFFFLADPDMLVGTHLPEDSRWQLLPVPISQADFTSCVYLRDRYYQMGCSVLANDCMNLVLRPENGEQTIQLGLPKSKSIAFDFKYLLFKDTNSCQNVKNKDLRGTVFNEQKPDVVSYKLQFPFRGRYRFDLFGVDTLEHEAFDLICSYVIEVNMACATFEILPDSPTIGWGPGVEAMRYGLQPITHQSSVIDAEDGKLQIRFKMTEQLSFGIQLKHNDKSSCELESHAVLRTEGGELVVDLRLSLRGQYAVKIYAKHGDEPGRLENVCNYLVKNAAASTEPSCFPYIYNDVLGKRVHVCDHFHIEAVSCADNIIVTAVSEMVFKFATHKDGVELFAHLSGLAITDGNVTEVITRSVRTIHTEFTLKLPATGEYSLNVFARVPQENKLYPVQCYLIQYDFSGTEFVNKTQISRAYITGEQMSIPHLTARPESTSTCFEKYFHMTGPGGAMDSAINTSQSGIGLNFMLSICEDDTYKLDAYEEISGCLILNKAHRLVPIEFDRYDEEAVEHRRTTAMALEATRRREEVALMAASRPPPVFNRDVIRARLKMTLIARNLQFAEAVLGTCHYYNYTDDDLVPRVQHLQLVISKQKELGKAIRNTIKSSLTVPLERVLEAIEQAGVEKEMGFLTAVARNILVKKLGEKIRKMDQTTVAEVKSYSNPPRAAQEVMRASLLLLGHRPSELQDWDSIRHLIGDTQKMKQRLRDVDVENINEDTAEEAERMMSILSREEIQRTSDVVDSFYSWSKNMIKLKFTRKADNNVADNTPEEEEGEEEEYQEAEEDVAEDAEQETQNL